MRTTAIALLFVLAFIPGASWAQTPRVIEGLIVIAERQYAMDPDAPITTEGGGIFLATARVYQFDTEEHANPVYGELVKAEGLTAQLPANDTSVKLHSAEIAGVGDRATVLNLVTTDTSLGKFRMVIAQDEAVLVTVTIIAGSDDAVQAAEEIARVMIEREPGTSASTFNAHGASSGGVWDVFPTTDAPELRGLQSFQDKEIRPAR